MKFSIKLLGGVAFAVVSFSFDPAKAHLF